VGAKEGMPVEQKSVRFKQSKDIFSGSATVLPALVAESMSTHGFMERFPMPVDKFRFSNTSFRSFTCLCISNESFLSQQPPTPWSGLACSWCQGHSTTLCTAYQRTDFFMNRAILTLRNDTVTELNEQILQGMHGEVHTFCSVDSADINENDDSNHKLSAEFLQSLSLVRLPPSVLRLKVGAPVILLRNLHPQEGLCNGTRLVVTRLLPNCVEAKILGGRFNNS
jgi:PIF1-like helicase